VQSYVSFNKKMFPKRNFNTAERLITWRIIQNPYFSYFDSGLISSINGEVTGQIIPIYSKFISGPNSYLGVWGSDYIVDDISKGSGVAVVVIRNIMKNYLHFAVGMSELSLKIHRALGEEKIGVRFDCLFLSKIQISRKKYSVITIEKFYEKFELFIPSKCGAKGCNYFERTIEFYTWIFMKVDQSKIKVIHNDLGDFVMFYHDSYFGMPIVKIVDFSLSLNLKPRVFADLVNIYGTRFLVRLFFYSGGIDVSPYFECFRSRKFPVLSNIFKKDFDFNNSSTLHLTALDSDRFISSFL
jgi:hypothetical protein